MRSDSEGAACVSFIASPSASSRTFLETLPDLLFREIAADEHDAALARLVLAPGALMVAVQDHMHALKHEPVRIVLERQDTLGAKDFRPLGRHEILHPGEELVGIERLSCAQRNRLHVLVVIVLQRALRGAVMAVAVIVVVIGRVGMIVMMIMVMAVSGIVAMVMVVVGLAEKGRLDLQDATGRRSPARF